MDIQNLYPAIQFPVSCSTPMIAPLIKWDHGQSWPIPTYDANQSKETLIIRKVDIDLSNPIYRYMEGHKIEGKSTILYRTVDWPA